MDSNAGAGGISGMNRGWRSQHLTHSPKVLAVIAVIAVIAGGCATANSDETTEITFGGTQPWEFLNLGPPVTSDDRWEVMLCQIPERTKDATFAPIDLRLAVTPAQIVAAINPVADYFSRWSQGRYTMTLMPGKTLVIGEQDEARACVESALDTSSDHATGVIVIADAAHRDDVPGGWAQPGVGCGPVTGSVTGRVTGTCPARESRRAVYVGAADFFEVSADGGNDMVALDLLEHEIGHVLGWPHSNRKTTIFDGDFQTTPGYNSIVDIMSNSAAPRAVNANRRHGPGVGAFNRLSAGWFNPEDITVINVSSKGVSTVSIAAPVMIGQVRRDHPQVVVVDLGDKKALTVELIVAAAENDHLLQSGIAIHLVQWGSDVCEVPGADGMCLGVDRRVSLLGKTIDGLLGVGQSVTVGEITMTVTALSGSAPDLIADVVIRRR